MLVDGRWLRASTGCSQAERAESEACVRSEPPAITSAFRNLGRCRLWSAPTRPNSPQMAGSFEVRAMSAIGAPARWLEMFRASDAGPCAGAVAGSGAGVRRPSEEEAAVSPRGAGRLRRGYGDIGPRRPPSGWRAGYDGGCQRLPEVSRAVAARAEPGAEARERGVWRLSAA